MEETQLVVTEKSMVEHSDKPLFEALSVIFGQNRVSRRDQNDRLSS